MTTAELMAVAVLKGDMTAARALAEHLIEDVNPVKGDKIENHKTIIDLPVDNVRIVAYTYEQYPAVQAHMYLATVEEWIREGGILMTMGVDRIEIYNI